jgi:hypothetical protein
MTVSFTPSSEHASTIEQITFAFFAKAEVAVSIENVLTFINDDGREEAIVECIDTGTHQTIFLTVDSNYQAWVSND